MLKIKRKLSNFLKTVIDFVLCQYWQGSGMDAFKYKRNIYFSGNRIDKVATLSGKFVIQSIWRVSRIEWLFSKARNR